MPRRSRSTLPCLPALARRSLALARSRVRPRACRPNVAPKLNLRCVGELAMKGKRPPHTKTHLDALARGVIWGMRLAGMSRADMAEHVQQPDGRAAPVNAIDRVIAKKRASPEWRGEERAREGGRP